MPNISNINYSNWKNEFAVDIARSVDKDGVKGLQYLEVIDFARQARKNSFEKAEIYELLEFSATQTRAASPSKSRERSDEFNKAINHYNTLKTSAREDVTEATFENMIQRLHDMEGNIDQAFIKCSAYQNICIMPTWHYRYYPYMYDRLTNFDIDEIRTKTSQDMNALQELKDEIQTAIENANGETNHTKPQTTNYDIETLAIKHLGMSYADFAKKYKNEINYCKTVTTASLYSMTPTQADVYYKLKAYASEMLNITINEAHKVRWDTGERIVDEQNKTTDDMFTIYEFEDDGITEEGLNKIGSGIMYKAFEQAVTDKYKSDKESGMDSPQDNKKRGTWKEWINGKLLIHKDNGADYNASGIRNR